MELLFYFFHFLVSLDQRWLRPLERWVPDLREALRAPAEVLREREIEIGPWTHYVKVYGFPALLLIPTFAIASEAATLAVTIGVSVAWLLVAAALMQAYRGGRCIIAAEGVEFHYGGIAVFCPWNLFKTYGRPVYHADQKRLDLPIAFEAAASVEHRKDGQVFAKGLHVPSRLVRVLPTGTLRLKHVYAVIPEELGSFLLELGHRLAGPAEISEPVRPVRPFVAEAEADGWIRVSLTRLNFPPVCCDCAGGSNEWQEFRGYQSLSSLSMTSGFLTLRAPVCKACQRANRGRYWRILIKTALLTVLAATGGGFVLGAILDLCGATFGPGAMTVLCTMSAMIVGFGFCWFIGAKRASAVSGPISLSDFRPSEGTVRIRFRNGKYADWFVAQSGLAAAGTSRTGARASVEIARTEF